MGFINDLFGFGKKKEAEKLAAQRAVEFATSKQSVSSNGIKITDRRAAPRTEADRAKQYAERQERQRVLDREDFDRRDRANAVAENERQSTRRRQQQDDDNSILMNAAIFSNTNYYSDPTPTYQSDPASSRSCGDDSSSGYSSSSSSDSGSSSSSDSSSSCSGD